jgi:hypothetical protein
MKLCGLPSHPEAREPSIVFVCTLQKFKNLQCQYARCGHGLGGQSVPIGICCRVPVKSNVPPVGYVRTFIRIGSCFLLALEHPDVRRPPDFHIAAVTKQYRCQ